MKRLKSKTKLKILLTKREQVKIIHDKTGDGSSGRGGRRERNRVAVVAAAAVVVTAVCGKCKCAAGKTLEGQEELRKKNLHEHFNCYALQLFVTVYLYVIRNWKVITNPHTRIKTPHMI